MEKKKGFRLGKNARRVLRYSLPLLVFSAYALTLYVAVPNGVSLTRDSATIVLLLETLSRACFCVALGTVLADYAERKKV